MTKQPPVTYATVAKQLWRGQGTRPRVHSGKSTQPLKVPRVTLPGNILLSAEWIGTNSDIVYVWCEAPAGTNPPTITDGWAQFSPIARPQRVALSGFQGYNPWAIDIELRLRLAGEHGGWLDDQWAGEQIELAVEQLLWMAGRGPLDASRGAQGVGPPPLVDVTTTDANGFAIPLLEFALQGSDTKTPKALTNSGRILWVITNIDFTIGVTHRNVRGYRTWEDVKVSLMQYSVDQFDQSVVQRAEANRAQASNIKQSKFDTGSKADWTLMKIAKKVGGNGGTIQNTAQAILKANATNKQMNSVRSVVHKIPKHTVVWIPAVR